MYLPRMRFRYGYKFGCPIKIFEMFMSFYWYQLNCNMYDICFTFNDSQFLRLSIQTQYNFFHSVWCGIILSGNDLVLKWIRIYIQYQQNIMIKFDLSDHRKNDLTVYLMRNIFFPTDEIWKKTDIISKSSIRCLLPLWHLSSTKFNTFDVLPFWHFLCSKKSNGIY